MKSINPTTNQLIKEYRPHIDSEIIASIDRADVCFQTYRKTSFTYRQELLRNISKLLKTQCETYATIISQEMGKCFKEAKAEIEKCALVCEYYASNGEKLLADRSIQTDASSSYFTYQPLGVILAVMPWNFPFWQVFRFAAPTLMAGNTILLKHASSVSGCSLAIEAIFKEAKFPPGAFQSLLISSSSVEKIISDTRVQGVTLTGSTDAGRSVAALAGQHLKKCVLELGGSDPYLILEDADLPHAVEACLRGRLLNAGQSCIAAKRFIVAQEIYDPFIKLCLQKIQEVEFGDPFDESTNIGPLASISLRDQLHDQVTHSIKAGAKCEYGGYVPNRQGAFYPPTLLTDIKPGMPAFDEELFGPVASVIKSNDEAHAICLANKSIFGLGSAIFTNNLTRGEEIAKHELFAGSCFVNDFVRSDPRLPFGGIKQSGYGRELSLYGIREFTNIKTVYIK